MTRFTPWKATVTCRVSDAVWPPSATAVTVIAQLPWASSSGAEKEPSSLRVTAVPAGPPDGAGEAPGPGLPPGRIDGPGTGVGLGGAGVLPGAPRYVDTTV